MAHMIPSYGPREYNPASQEGRIYDALTQLPDDFWVIHSLKFVNVDDSYTLGEREADFVVYHKDLGIVCIEAKAGHARCESGEWVYADGRPMRNGGPYNQANSLRWKLNELFDEKGISDLHPKCKITFAVWFVSLDRAAINNIDWPSEANYRQTLCADDLCAPEAALRRVFDIEVRGESMSLSEREAQTVLTRVLCPSFDIAPAKGYRYDFADYQFVRLLDSQVRVLNFLQDQRVAVINGAAGTGKTLLAVERAKDVADRGDRALFLCYNSLLKDDIKSRCEGDKNIDVYTIAAYACGMCNSPEPDYEALAEKLLEYVGTGSFPYKHVVIDEGQDFGVAAIENAGVLDILLSLVQEREAGTFYMFYDKRQFVQGSTIPGFINDADCKLTLYVNCRNTADIAKCSMRALGETDKDNVKDSYVVSRPPKLFHSESSVGQEQYVDRAIAELRESGLDDIVILTCRTIENSALSSCFEGTGNRRKWKASRVPVFTCRTFKGLEADAVILVDVDETLWKEPTWEFDPDPGLIFYAGASRAKHELRIVCNMGEEGCLRVLEALGVEGRRKPFSGLVKKLNAVFA